MLSFGYLWIALINKSDAFLRRYCPPIYNLLFTSKYPIIRQLLSVPIGFLTGYIFYSYIVYRFELEPKMERVVRYTIVSLITLMFTVSVEMRAICSLVLPTFLGRSTRNFMIASVIISLISNPLMNTFDNSVILSEWVYCTASVGLDQGLAATQLVYEPITQIVSRMSSTDQTFLTNDSEFDTLLAKFNKNFKSIIKQKENTNERQKEDQTIFSRFQKNLDLICKDKVQPKLENCYEHFVSPHTHWWFWVIDSGIKMTENIKPFEICQNEKFKKFMNKTCKVEDNGTLSKNPSLLGAVKDMQLLDTKNMTIRHNLDFIPNITNILRYKQVLKEVESYTKIAKDYSLMSAKVGKNLFLVVFLFVFFSSKSYHNKYLTDISFDNNYITNYFRRIDARRKKVNKLSLLPLKKIEKLELIDPFGWKLTKTEKSHAKISTFLLIIFLLFIFLVQQIDVLLYDTIDLIRSEIDINVFQYGYNEMHPNVSGKDSYDGWMARKMRKLFNNFEYQTHLFKISSFNTCAPNPIKTEDFVKTEFYTTFVVICLLNYMEMYSLRWRRVICSYFYRIRSKKRTLFLYNRTLKKRKGFLRYSIQRVRQLVNQKLFDYPKDSIGDTFAYGLINQNNCGLLLRIIQKIFSFFIRNKCIICDEYILKNQKQFKCIKCNLNYCNQCWTECYQRCLVCSPQLFEDH